MKKLTVILMVILMVMLFSGCSKDDDCDEYVATLERYSEWISQSKNTAEIGRLREELAFKLGQLDCN